MSSRCGCGDFPLAPVVTAGNSGDARRVPSAAPNPTLATAGKPVQAATALFFCFAYSKPGERHVRVETPGCGFCPSGSWEHPRVPSWALGRDEGTALPAKTS